MHPTRQWYSHLDVLFEALESSNEDEEFELDLAEALKALHSSDWNREFDPHGITGHDFSFPISKEFVIIFRRVTDRDGHGHPLLVHFYLKMIARRN